MTLVRLSACLTPRVLQSLPMAMTGEAADDTEGESGSCRSVCGGVPVCHGEIALCFP